MRKPLPTGGGGLTVTETMVTVTDLLHALNVQMFELAMWQAMSGNCIAPHQRVDARADPWKFSDKTCSPMQRGREPRRN